MLTTVIVFIAAMLLATPTLAKPPKFVPTGQCNCACGAGSLSKWEIYGPGAACSDYIGKTCNIEDPKTGGTRSGRVVDCTEVLKEEAAKPLTKELPKDLPELQPAQPKTQPKVLPKGSIQQQP
jgi:hypothetical protein